MSNFEDIVLTPVLEGHFAVPVDGFVLKSAQGEIADLLAEVSSDPVGGGLLLRIRDQQGRNIGNLFPKKRHLTVADTASAEGFLAGTIPVEFPVLWPPSRTSFTIAGATSSSTEISFADLVLPAYGADQLNTAQIRAKFDELSGKEASPRGAEVEVEVEAGALYEYVAILRNTQLPFTNAGTKVTTEHPFLGEKWSDSRDSWVSDVLGGTLCLQQKGEHTWVHFRIRSLEDPDRMEKAFGSYLLAIGFMLAINPWPVYRELRIDSKLAERKIHVVKMTPQGRFLPITERVSWEHPDAPGRLLHALATKIKGLDTDAVEEIERLLWVFRSADNHELPLPVQILLVCTVIEGLLGFVESAVPEADDRIREIRETALEWCDNARSEGDGALFKSLRSHLQNWRGVSRREAWGRVFGALSPANRDWVDEMYAIFKNNRHGLAHGAYASGGPGADFDTISQLAGFVNCMVAAHCGYRGTMVSDLFSGDTIEIP